LSTAPSTLGGRKLSPAASFLSAAHLNLGGGATVSRRKALAAANGFWGGFREVSENSAGRPGDCPLPLAQVSQIVHFELELRLRGSATESGWAAAAELLELDEDHALTVAMGITALVVDLVDVREVAVGATVGHVEIVSFN
jgi:hypothetical protein